MVLCWGVAGGVVHDSLAQNSLVEKNGEKK